MAKKHEHSVTAPAFKAYEALRRAVVELGYNVTRTDGRSMNMQFRAKRTRWSAEVAMSAMVVDEGEDLATISLTGRASSWTIRTEEGVVSIELFKKIEEILPKLPDRKPTAAASTQPQSGGDRLLSELERLAALHSSGALDDDEFKLAKGRLLGAGPNAQPTVAAEGSGGTGKLIAAAGAGGLGGALLAGSGTASAAPVAGEPVTENISYSETFTTPEGDTMTVEGEMDSSVTFDESGDAHVEIHDEGSMIIDGETYDYDTEIEGDVDFDSGGDLDSGGGEDVGLFDSIFG